MSWQYTSASIVGTKADPQPGDTITVTIQDTGSARSADFTWTFDGQMDKAAFTAMVKRETGFMVDHMNALSAAPVDCTEDFRPAAEIPAQEATQSVSTKPKRTRSARKKA
jgi:hypothetical protein